MTAIRIVQPLDKRNGVIVSIITMSLIFVYLYLTTFLMADPPPQDISPVVTETTIDQLELKNLVVEQGGSGSGTPSDNVVAPPRPQTEKILTQKHNPNHQTTSGQSTNNSANNSNNTSSSTQQSNNPFGTGGDGGTKGSGTGGAFGNDQGNGGNGPGGNGNGEGRIRLNDPKLDHIETSVKIVVHLKLTIDANGFIISVKNLATTTTTDQRIINQVIAAVKNQVKYNKDPGTGLVTVFLTLQVNAI